MPASSIPRVRNGGGWHRDCWDRPPGSRAELRQVANLLGDVDIGGDCLERAGLEEQAQRRPPIGRHANLVIVDPDGGTALGEIAAGPGVEAQADGAPEELADRRPPDGHRLAGRTGGPVLVQRPMALGNGRAVKVRSCLLDLAPAQEGKAVQPRGRREIARCQPRRRQPSGKMPGMSRRMSGHDRELAILPGLDLGRRQPLALLQVARQGHQACQRAGDDGRPGQPGNAAADAREKAFRDGHGRNTPRTSAARKPFLLRPFGVRFGSQLPALRAARTLPHAHSRHQFRQP